MVFIPIRRSGKTQAMLVKMHYTGITLLGSQLFTVSAFFELYPLFYSTATYTLFRVFSNYSE